MDFAIQLGSASTVIYKKNDGIVLNEATKIAYTRVRVGAEKKRKKGDEEKAKYRLNIVAVGEAARRMQDRADRSVIIESPVNGGKVTDMELAKRYFGDIFKKVAGSLAFSRNCLFCIPCSLSAAEVNDFKSVAYASGVDSMEFVPNVIAGAIAMGADVLGSSAVMYVNIAESGTEIAVITYGGMLAGGSIEDGGALATKAVHDFIESKHRIVISRHMAERAKIECATLLLNNEVSFKVKGVDAETGTPKEVWFNGVDCYRAMFPIYSRIAKAILQVLHECNPDVINDLKAGAIYIGGGASSPSGLREFMTMNLDMNVVLNADSVNAVIMGAGRLLNDKVLLKKIIKAN
jgi:rod shape-determining protein MreB